MRRNDPSKQSVKDLKRTLKDRVRRTRAAGANGTTLNVAHRTNVVVAGNVGENGSTYDASATQVDDIRQSSRTAR